MAYNDPQSVKDLNGTATSLPRTGSSQTTGEFRSADQVYKLVVAHNRGKRTQHVARVEFADLVANPLVPNQNQVVSAAATFTVNVPLNGLSAAQALALAKSLRDWASDANLLKLVGSEI